MTLANTVKTFTTVGAEYQQSDNEFIVTVNNSLGRHQIGVFTDVVPTAGTAAVWFEVSSGIYQEVQEDGAAKVVDLTAAQPFSIDIHTTSFKFILTGFDADKFVGATIYSKNDLS